jgi:hypothetical protein
MEEDKARNWNFFCSESIRKEKAEISKKYNIIFGQTEIYCARCKGPMPFNFKLHTCSDIRLKKLNETKKANSVKTLELCFKLKRIGIKKASIMLYEERNGEVIREVSERTVRGWIQRGNIPIEYQEVVSAL